MTALPPIHTAGQTRPIRVNEVFGPTIQGEGPSAGRLATFLRLSGCNLDCAWCDTPYTWDWDGKNGVAYSRTEETRPVSNLARLAKLLCDRGAPLIVVTGGEPLLQAGRVLDLARRVYARGGHVLEVETNGTLPIPEHFAGVTYNVSPKLGHSGVDPARAIVPKVLSTLGARFDVRLKFVAADEDDVAEALEVIDRFSIPRARCWIMPEGRTATEVHDRLRALADPVVAAGLNLSPRLHVTCWEDQRAR